MGFVKVIGFTVVGFGVLIGAAIIIAQSPMGKEFINARQNFDPSIPVTMEPISFGDLERTISAPGSIEPKKLINISSQVSAKVLALPFEEGQLVKKDDVVIRLDPQNLVAALDSAKAGLKGQEASLGGSEAALINARLSFERLEQLYETGDATLAELDAARASFLQAQSNRQVLIHQIEQGKAQIDRAQKDLDNTVIVSPIDGIITALNTEVGETVIVGTTNNPGSIIMEIADLSEMLLNASVDEANISPVEIGQSARIYVNAFTDRQYDGTIQRIGLKRQVAGDGTGTFKVEILMNLEEGETLYSGLSASTDIIVEHFYDSMIVPSQAVVDRRIDELPKDITQGHELVDHEKTFTRIVYRVIDGKAIATPVEVGPSDLTQTVITKGLTKDDLIITGPFRAMIDLQHDQMVKDQNAPDQETIDQAKAASKSKRNSNEADEPTEDTSEEEESSDPEPENEEGSP